VKTLIVTSSWPRTGDEMAGTFVRSDALGRGPSIVVAPEGPGVARGGPELEIVDAPHGGLFGSPGAIHRLRRSPLSIFGLNPYFQAVRRVVQERRPASIVAHWLVPGGLVARLAAPELSIELVAHGADVRLLEAMPRSMARSVLAKLCDGDVRVRAVSETLAERIDRIRARTVSLIEPMPLADVTSVRVEAELLRARHGSYAVIAARMVREKRIERAIEAARHRLVLVGDGPERARLIGYARDRGLDVIATGALPHEHALAWIAGADLVLAPLARGEGAPTVIREAIALGRPVRAFE
jgi:glycosyltransferase involved in cell wall biosynthesis